MPNLILHTGSGKKPTAETDYDDLALRLAAAYFSYLLGHKSIDYTLKTVVLHGNDECNPGEYWRQIAHTVADKASE